MPSTTYLLAALVPFATGCLLEEELPQPDVANLNVTMSWTGKGTRGLSVSVPKTIPCTGTEDEFLGESGVRCVSAPWTLTVNGEDVGTTPVSCEAAHDGWFGPVAKSCEGGGSTPVVLDGAYTVVEIVATSEVDERRVTYRDLARTFTWTEVAPLESASNPGIVRVDGLDVEGSGLSVWFTPPGGGAEIRGTAHALTSGSGELAIEPTNTVSDGVYAVRVQAYARIDGLRTPVPIEGTLTVAR